MAQIPKPIPHRKKFVRRDNPLRWLLIPLFVVIGSIGGAIGGELGPIAIEGGRLRLPPHFFALFAGFGALVGILPGLLGGILTVDYGDSGFLLLGFVGSTGTRLSLPRQLRGLLEKETARRVQRDQCPTAIRRTATRNRMTTAPIRKKAEVTAVHSGKAPIEYQDPIAFFDRTHITRGMELLSLASQLFAEPIVAAVDGRLRLRRRHRQRAVLHGREPFPKACGRRCRPLSRVP